MQYFDIGLINCRIIIRPRGGGFLLGRRPRPFVGGLGTGICKCSFLSGLLGRSLDIPDEKLRLGKKNKYSLEIVLRFGLPPSVLCFGLAADCLQSYYPISHASSMRRRRTWPTCLYLVCISTCIVFPPSGHSTLPIFPHLAFILFCLLSEFQLTFR